MAITLNIAIITIINKHKKANKLGWLGADYVVVITTAQLHSTKPELRFCAGPNPTRGKLEIHNGEHPW